MNTIYDFPESLPFTRARTTLDYLTEEEVRFSRLLSKRTFCSRAKFAIN